MTFFPFPLHRRHNGSDSVLNHQLHDCLLTRLFRRRSKKTSKLRVTGLCEGNSPVTGEFPAQRPVTRKNNNTYMIQSNNYDIKHMLTIHNAIPYMTCTLYYIIIQFFEVCIKSVQTALIIPPPNEVGVGVYWIHLVRPSVRLSVDNMVSGA